MANRMTDDDSERNPPSIVEPSYIRSDGLWSVERHIAIMGLIGCVVLVAVIIGRLWRS